LKTEEKRENGNEKMENGSEGVRHPLGICIDEKRKGLREEGFVS
jgi:hypothetical protein